MFLLRDSREADNRQCFLMVTPILTDCRRLKLQPRNKVLISVLVVVIGDLLLLANDPPPNLITE